jgi:hypothetical protein
MMSARSFFARFPYALLLACIGCGQASSPTAVPDLNEPGPRFTFANAPSTPNVFRGEAGIVMSFFDPESGLDIWIGLPEDPSSVFFCDGPSFDIGPVAEQSAGQLQDAFNALFLGRGMEIHVYAKDDNTSFTDVCVDSPIAQGTGNLTSNDNDVLTAGPGANSFNLRIQGTLDDVVNGGKLRVTGVFHYVFLPNGTFKVLRQSVALHPIGR